jgi:hypothetical protein
MEVESIRNPEMRRVNIETLDFGYWMLHAGYPNNNDREHSVKKKRPSQ